MMHEVEIAYHGKAPPPSDFSFNSKLFKNLLKNLSLTQYINRANEEVTIDLRLQFKPVITLNITTNQQTPNNKSISSFGGAPSPV
jgi:hypothetical protein